MDLFRENSGTVYPLNHFHLLSAMLLLYAQCSDNQWGPAIVTFPFIIPFNKAGQA